MAAFAGCESGPVEQAWQSASPELARLGVDGTRVVAQTPARQEVELGDRDGARIGAVVVVESADEHAVQVTLHGHAFAQTVQPELGLMTVTLDGRSESLWMDGTAPSAAALALLEDATVYVEIVRLLASDEGVLVAAHEAAPPAQLPGVVAAVPPLVCSTFLVTTAGWAWFWEVNPTKMACRRANDAANVLCALSTGAPCCELPQACSACLNLGTGTACYTAGYLQFTP